jgi:hypothetical protein
MTKKQLEIEVKERICGLPMGAIIPPNKEYFLELFKRHPEYGEKVGKGVQSIILRQNRLNKSARELYIVRVDGSEVDHCGEGEFKRLSDEWIEFNSLPNSFED